MNVIEKIKNNIETFTKSEFKVAKYFMENPDDFAFETIGEISNKIKTSTTSVIRFCQKLGFDGYKPFQDDVRLNLKCKFTLPDKMKIASETSGQNDNYSKYAYNAVSCIEETFNGISTVKIANIVSSISKAKRVFCFGMKESYALAHYAYTRFLTVRNNVFMLSAGQSGEIESVLTLNKDDVCVAFIFHRYTRQAPRILKLIKKQGATTILITSPPYDELEDDSSFIIPVFVDISGIKNSAAAPVCLTDCLCNALAAEIGADALDYMKNSELLFKDFTF